MKKKHGNTDLPERQDVSEEKDDLEGYPLYPQDEDIYSKYNKGEDLNPEDISRSKRSYGKNKSGTNNEKDFDDDFSGDDLDIPGTELDDDQEMIGSEDEENNYYSIGGDDHNDLDEDDGE